MKRRSIGLNAMALGICLACVDSNATALAGTLADDTNVPSGSRAPYQAAAAHKAVKFWEGRVATTPGRFLEYRELAGAYLARHREAGDIEDAVRA
jgi:hypothetical protein